MKERLPDFKNEDEERRFWATADSTKYVNWQSLKVLANRRDVPYQSLLKVFLAERLAQERQSQSH
ncbi:MAG: CopG family antitoxin [Bryobacteraceae bacterium]